MPDFPVFDGTYVVDVASVTASSRGTTVTAGGSANTKSASWVQLIASTAYHAVGVWVSLDQSGAGRDCLIDIAIGGAGSEVVILSNLYCGSGTGSISYCSGYYFPIEIPAGTRLSAKSQSTTASTGVTVQILLHSQGMMASDPCQLVTTYGANTADSGGQSVDPGGTVVTKGSYTEITSSTTYPANYLCIAIGNQVNTIRGNYWWLVDIAIGAGGSEQVIIGNLQLNSGTSADVVMPQSFYMLPVSIPAGTRIAARAECSNTDATDRLFDIIVYLVT